MRRQVPFVLLAAVAAIAIAWWWLRDPELAPHRDANTRTPDPAAPANTSTATPGSEATDAPRREDGAPTAVVDWNAATKGLSFRVRLRGLHPKAPWTGPMHVWLKGRDDARDQWLSFSDTHTPDVDGRATFVVPDWCATATQQKGRLEGRDENYQRLDRRWDGRPDLEHELVLDVQVVGVLTGRVLDSAGAPVEAARVVAFPLRDGQPVDGSLASTYTQADGVYRIAVPPDAPLWLLAVAIRRMKGRGIAGDDEGGVIGVMREDLLPAATTATGTIGTPTSVPDLVLAAAARIGGRATWSDGEPIAKAQVQAMPRDGASFALAHTGFVQRLPDGRLAPGAIATTDERGEFVLPAAAGTRVDVQLVALDGDDRAPAFLGPRPSQPAVAPQRVELAVPRPLVLRLLDGDAPITGATLEVAGQRTLRSWRNPEFRCIVTAPQRVRGLHQRLRSPWREIGPGDAGTRIDLALRSELTPVSIEFDGEFRVRNTVVTWRRDDGLEGREHLLRDDRPGAFQVFLEPGTYHLAAGPGGGERNGFFLLPSERDVEVGAEPVSLRLPAIFGGTFTVMATDSSGLYVAGTCELRDGAGTDCTASFRLENGGASGRPGEILAGGTNSFTRVLPPGDYELLCDFGAHGAHRAVVTIKPRETTEARIRLP